MTPSCYLCQSREGDYDGFCRYCHEALAAAREKGRREGWAQGVEAAAREADTMALEALAADDGPWFADADRFEAVGKRIRALPAPGTEAADAQHLD